MQTLLLNFLHINHNQPIVVAYPGVPERVNDCQRSYELKQLRYEGLMKCQSLIPGPAKINETIVQKIYLKNKKE